MKVLKKTLATFFLLALLFVNTSISIHDTPLRIGNVLTTVVFGDGDLEEGGGGLVLE